MNDNPVNPNRRHVKFNREYLDALHKCDEHFFAQVLKEPLLLFLPILDIHATFLYGLLNDAATYFLAGRGNSHEKLELIEKAWDSLRMMKHDGMGPIQCIRSYARNNNNKCDFLKSEEYKNLAERFSCIEAQISSTETLARDYIQHYIGRLSLEESRASIKQAIVALEESRWTKLSKYCLSPHIFYYSLTIFLFFSLPQLPRYLTVRKLSNCSGNSFCANKPKHIRIWDEHL